MAKVPVAGMVKTRLQPFLPPEKCVELATAFLHDAEAKAKFVCENSILAYSPADKKTVLKNILRSEIMVIEQTGSNLGKRISNAFEYAFNKHSDAVVVLGTDSPTFPAEFIEQAFEFLEKNAEIVLGKSEDGGFYLIGLCRENRIKLYENISWSSSEVFEQIRKNAARLKLRLREIPAWYDVDTPADFIKLREEFLASNAAKKVAPETYQWMLSNSDLFDSI